MKAQFDRNIKRDDVTLVYKHPEAKVDIVLLHGLNGNPVKTWTAANQVYWPADLLPETFKEAGVQANVLVYGYNADVIGTTDKKINANPIHLHAQTLVSYLTTFRKQHTSPRNPIIWVAHSLGGILLKRALQLSDNMRASTHEDQRAIYVSTFAIVFLGTPHEGSDLARWGELLRGIFGVFPRRMWDTDTPLIKTLLKDSETLDNINASFVEIQQRFRIHLVYENQKTDLKGTMALVVDHHSAAPRWYNTTSYGIEADHSGMCKFSSASAPGYRQITSVITDWIRQSSEFIAYRWFSEDQDRRMRAQRNLNELATQFLPDLVSGLSPTVVAAHGTVLNNQILQNAPPSPLPTLPMLPPSQSTTQDSIRSHGTASQLAPEDYRIVPEGFRANSYFVGREAELQELHRMLQDAKRRSRGTSTVLIHCQTGGGKTHMAREYYFRHQQDYSGGMFWLRASSVQELEGEFSRIAKIALKQLRTKVDHHDLKDPAKMIDHVRTWFEGMEDWLIIFDGIMFDQEGIERFFPNHVNTSMILLSTSSAVSGDYHFNNPRPLSLPFMSTQEAQKLLLMEIEKEEPWSQDDLARAAELVLSLEKLPLMIHVIAQHLKSSQEPLSTYLKRYKAKPPRIGRMPAYDLVLDQMQARGAIAALNVLCVLAFLDQHTPVEMLSLGLRVLDKRDTPYKTRDALTHGIQSLNNTLKVLIAFALVERSDRYNLSRASSKTSKRSFELTEDTMDTLHVHTVVQRYLIEYLTDRRLHIFWLERSVEVFLCAFVEANSRIKEKPNVGLPDDYRRFLLHGRKLMQHLVVYEGKHAGELVPVREELEAQLEVIEEEIRNRTKGSQSDIVNQVVGISRISVFDKAKGLSDSDTGTTGSHPGSQRAWTPDETGPSEFFQSPIDSHFLSSYNHQGTPYPVDDDLSTPHITPRPPLSQINTPVPDNRKGRRSSSSSLSRNTKDVFYKLKENFPFGKRRKSSTSTTSKHERPVPTSARTSPGGEYVAKMPFMPPIETRSAKSSPGHGATGPFTPPSLQGTRTSLPRTSHNPQPSFQHHDSIAYLPRQQLTRVESSSLGLDIMATSFGSPEYAISPPMSRESSRPPSTSRGRGSHDSFAGNLAVPATARRVRRTSSPLSRPASSRQFTAQRRRDTSGRYSSSPSPSSPHTASSSKPHLPVSARPPTDPQKPADTSAAVSPPSFVSMPVPRAPTIPATKPSWLESNKILGKIRRLSGKGRAKPGQTDAEPSAASTASSETIEGSRSGGFVIGDGNDRQVISFGEVAVRMDDARGRLQRRLHHAQEAQPESAVSDEGEDVHIAGLAITLPSEKDDS
ncbi:hypothetical protein BD289DRAFT_403349 [Coniella lustricola]|uniref:DUF676 domain-containing protein n=1 Tax=Coniella lustricola TaxID=2025994 RepID=A0A2T3AHG3_9PEZI|nr:hypothetical protein BD289DRAFT_403349 [Coniella lustricola]